MAAMHANSSIASRTRSTRMPTANSSRPLAPVKKTADPPPTAGSNNAASTQAESLDGVSNVSMFLKSLHLLDLDLLDDWPDISSQTFSARDAGQGQKRRIQCVEWALFQLFALWHPEEARNVRCISRAKHLLYVGGALCS